MATSKHRRARRTAEDNTFDRILASFLSEKAEDELTLHEKEVRARYVAIQALSEAHYLDSDIIKIHIEKQEELGRPISRATAYRDLAAAQELFGEINKTTRQAKRYALLQLAKKGLQLADKFEDARGYAAQIRNMIMIEGLHKDDLSVVDPEQVQPPQFIIQIGSKQVDLNTLKGIKDIDFQEVVELVQEEQLDEQKMLGYLNELDEERE
ncbi:hypothetical protein [Pontibacter sp. SGAir0037]|uniref:hypothetical protein n=1 Tax=Pontibacter sp. SGAir0037 TaxID=2571030 RepID=UPI0010CD5DC8|nr:hypothetical protein [Pontibacter sp. SGAir0037]QCR23082.1 hypothetical protein C1N53_12490 [Pontibacter sp. SGAir0037]